MPNRRSMRHMTRFISTTLAALMLLGPGVGAVWASDLESAETSVVTQAPAETATPAPEPETTAAPEETPSQTPDPTPSPAPEAQPAPSSTPAAPQTTPTPQTSRPTQSVYTGYDGRASVKRESPAAWQLPTFAKALVDLAEQEYGQYGDTACGGRYWGWHRYGPWSVDFLYWCGRQLGLNSADGVFGPDTSWPGYGLWNLVQQGAQVYYPGDGTIPQAGDIVVWWCGGRPGQASDGIPYTEAISMGIVTQGTQEQVTLIQGHTTSWAPTKSVLSKMTCSLKKNLFGNVSILLLLRPEYPQILSEAQKGTIQSLLLGRLYGGAGGIVCCDFDGYTDTPGRHEGIDFCRGAGSGIYALTEGTVIRIRTGTNNEHLSTIAVYDRAHDQTVVYLHCAPAASLSVGQEVHRGDYLGTEAARGATAAHTHVEVVQGLSYSANVSVGDATLDNTDPYPYWAQVLGEEIAEYAGYYHLGAQAAADAGLRIPEKPLNAEIVAGLLKSGT